jgi:hypothetical protein
MGPAAPVSGNAFHDGRHLVGAGLGQISGREEEKCVVSSQIAVEDAAILRGDDLEAAGPPNVCEGRFGKRWSPARSLYEVMLEAGGFSEEEDLSIPLVVIFRRESVRQSGCHESRPCKRANPRRHADLERRPALKTQNQNVRDRNPIVYFQDSSVPFWTSRMLLAVSKPMNTQRNFEYSFLSV